jgi:hypothetical protein
LLAMFLTSSVERLAKLPGLVLSVGMLMKFDTRMFDMDSM